jgi:hypothetical protein
MKRDGERDFCMKNFSLLQPRVLASGLTLLCGLGYSLPAQAHWEIRLSYSRELSYTSWDWGMNAMKTTNAPTIYPSTGWQSSGEVTTSNTLISAEGRYAGTARHNQKNVVTGELRWVPASGETIETDPPTDKVFVKLRSKASTGFTPVANSSHSESNGLKTDSVQVSTSTNSSTGQTSATWESSNWDGAPIILAIDNKDSASTIEFGPFEVFSQGNVNQPISVFSPYPGASYVTDHGSRIGPFMTFGAELTNRGAFISSGFDPSWKKFAGAASALPPAYRQRGTNGAYTNQPNNNAVQVAGTDTPSDASDDLWKLLCLRNPDGTMDVHSEARFTRGEVPTPSSPAITWEWFARPTGMSPTGSMEVLQFHANQQGFVTPDYTWSFSGGSLVNTAPSPTYENLYIRHSDAYSSTGVSGVKLGSTTDLSLPLTKATVTVVDLDPGSPSDSIKDEYTVNWHLPVENDVLTFSTRTSTDTQAMTTGTIGNQPDTQEKDGNLEVWLDPQPWKSIVAYNGTDWVVLGTAATLLTGGSAYAVEMGVQGLGGVANLGKALAGTTIALAAGGGSYAFTSAPTASEKKTIQNSSAQWGQAVDDTFEALKPPSQRTINPNAQIRIDPPSALNGYTEAQLKDTTWETNPLWSSFKMIPRIRRFYDESFYDGDAYDEHGYCGVAKTHLSLPYGSPELYGQYELQTAAMAQF